MAEITIYAEANRPAIRLLISEQDPFRCLIFNPLMKHYSLQKIEGMTSGRQA